MAKTKISEFSTTAGNNTDINSINIAEGCAPSGINDAIRELMRQLKEFQTGGAGDSVNSGGDFSVATNKFTVASASGNTAVAGTLGVTGAATLSSTLAVTGTTTLTGALVANGNATLGDGSGDTVTVKGTPTLEVNPTLSGGTANGVLYLNGSKVATSGSALVFDGTNLGIGTSSPSVKLDVVGTAKFSGGGGYVSYGNNGYIRTDIANKLAFQVGTSGATWRNSGNSGDLMLLDNSGNLGLGVTPSASSACVNMELGSYGSTLSARNTSSAPQFAMMSNAVGNWYAPTYKISARATMYAMQGNDGTHAWYTAPSGTAGDAISFTQALTLDASGKLGLGTTSPGAQLTVIGSAAKLYVDLSGDNYYDAANHVFRNFAGSERARIDSSGNLLIGKTTTANTTRGVYLSDVGQIISAQPTGGGAADFYNTSGGTQVGSIVINASTTSYNTSSDYRLKNTIAPMTGALAKVALLKPCTYKWNADGSDGEGFIAHELAEVVPQCVTGQKDAVDAEGKPKYQGIDTSFLVATLTAAIQEQQAIIESLKARLDAANL